MCDVWVEGVVRILNQFADFASDVSRHDAIDMCEGMRVVCAVPHNCRKRDIGRMKDAHVGKITRH